MRSVNIFDSGSKNVIMYLFITIDQRIYTHIYLIVIDAVKYRMMMFDKERYYDPLYDPCFLAV